MLPNSYEIQTYKATLKAVSGENVLKIIGKGASDAYGASLAYFTLFSQPTPVPPQSNTTIQPTPVTPQTNVSIPASDSTRNRFSSQDTFSTIVERKGIPDVENFQGKIGNWRVEKG